MSEGKLEIKNTSLPGVLLIKPPTMFEDFRGEYVESYNEKLYTDAGITRFVQDDFSVSGKDVLRGFHGDKSTTKLISCMLGRIHVVIVNYDERSPHFRKWESFSLTEKNRLQLLVPPQHGVAHLVLTERAIFAYKQSTYYDRASQFTLKWNDPSLNVWWPIERPILSKRDAGLE